MHIQPWKVEEQQRGWEGLVAEEAPQLAFIVSRLGQRGSGGAPGSSCASTCRSGGSVSSVFCGQIFGSYCVIKLRKVVLSSSWATSSRRTSETTERGWPRRKVSVPGIISPSSCLITLLAALESGMRAGNVVARTEVLFEDMFEDKTDRKIEPTLKITLFSEVPARSCGPVANVIWSWALQIWEKFAKEEY